MATREAVIGLGDYLEEVGTVADEEVLEENVSDGRDDDRYGCGDGVGVPSFLEGEEAEADERDGNWSAEMGDGDDDGRSDWRHFFDTLEIEPIFEARQEAGSDERGEENKKRNWHDY